MRSSIASFLLAVLASVPAAGQTPQTPQESSPTPATIEGRIVGVEEEHFVLDIGARSGARVGLSVELFRPLKLKNPATGRTIEDRYRIGALRITEVLEVVSFAAPEAGGRRPPAPGDLVVLRVEPAPNPVPPAGEAKEPRENPSNAFAPTSSEEPSPLRGSVEKPQERLGPHEVPTRAELSARPLGARFLPPEAGLSGTPLELGVELEGAPRGAVLHTRNAGEVAYVSTPMRGAGSRFWVATVPRERVTAPAIEYFIEAVRPDGSTQPVVGSPGEPLRIRTPEAPKPAPPLAHRSLASVYTDYADYNRLIGNDRVWQTEGYFGMRFADRGVRALRTGFGVYRGRGGSIEELDVLDLRPRAVGLTYGYLESEFGVTETVSLIGRFILGLGDAGVTGGGQAHVRIGSDLDTNLLVGGEVLGKIGLRGSAQLELWPKARVPVTVRTEVTNQPAGASSETPEAPGVASPVARGRSEIGGRIILQGGYRILDPLVVFARVSGGGRTIHHAGPGFGGGVTYEW